ncbi:RHS repeat-associated core domain-containing protein [Polyangium sp. 6x1]|uniref:RHS repeat-associated core domain-containing protein n=1 Tax=Polyangium sp. 6x1 TaxID=3042689 RepID=UPI002482E498|nr:RHS repeat-associated core domain-containing protein [Polyangium sp. 6x1]MDI1447300.1 RHS repeat-associated core domain-containing protein [Polyangium sp. 6x1]
MCPSSEEIADPFPTPLTAGQTSPAGRVASRFSTTNAGEARYEVPIEVPPGRAGVEPKLAITYDSAAGDGPLGVGFAVAGFSVITRCPRTVAQDGEIRGVRYDDGDALCLDGLRLVEVSEDEFRTFPDTFVKVVREGAKFRAFTKEGLILTYGALGRAFWITRAEDRSRNFVAYAYHDEGGEIVPKAIEYTGHPEVPGTRRVDFVYTQKPASAQHVVFGAGKTFRSSRQLLRIRTWAEGKLVREYRFTEEPSPTTGRLLLTTMEECAGDGVCKPPLSFGWNTPELGLDDIPTSLLLPSSPKASVMPMDVTGDGRDDLVVMDLPSGDANSGETPRTRAMVSVNAGPSAPQPFLQPYTIGAERVHYAEDLAAMKVPEPEAATPIDYNDDGRADLLLHDVYGRGPIWKLLIHEPDQSFSLLQTSIDRPFPSIQHIGAGVNAQDASGHLADVNGDGKVDLLQCRWYGAAPEWSLHRWAPQGFETAEQPLPALSTQPCDTELYTIDADGDGTTELLMREAKISSSSPLYLSRYVVAKFDSAGVVTLSDPKLATPPSERAMLLVDVNGDRLPDAVQWGWGDAFRTFLNTGDGFLEPVVALSNPIVPVEKHARLATPLDWDGDGRTDLLMPMETAGGSQWRILRSRGDGTFAVENAGIPFDAALTDEGVKLADPHGPRVLDVDGDGAHDVLLPIGSTFRIFRNRARFPDVLASAMDGMNPQRPNVAISYGTLVDESVAINAPAGSFVHDAFPYVSRYDEGNECEYPVRCVVGPRRVVTGYEIDTGAAKPRRFGVRYRDGRWHRLGRGFLGFGMRIVDDLDTKAGVAEVFDVATWDEDLRAFPFAPHMIRSWSWAPSREPETDDKIEVTWSSSILAKVVTTGGASYFVTSGLRREVHAQGSFWAYETPFKTPESFARDAMRGAAPATRIRDTIHVVGDVDAFGDVLAERTYIGRDHGIGLVPASTAELVEDAERIFENDTSKWIVGRLAEETACSTAGDETACRTTRQEHDILGRLKRIEVESEGDAETKLGVLFNRDVFGNVIRTVATDAFEGKRAACVSYDEQGLFPFARKNALGHLSFERYDPGTGAQLAEVDPNALATAWAVDGFGRVTREVRPDGTETVVTRQFVQGRIAITRAAVGWGAETAEIDRLGRTLRTWSSGVSAPGQLAPRVLREVVYDDLGEHVAKEYVADAETAPAATRKYTAYEYDAVGRAKREVSPWCGVTETRYNGATVVTKNARGFVTETTLDSLGRPVRVYDAEKGLTQYEYGPAGPRKVIDPGGAETVFERDGLGRVRFSKDPDRGASETHYNGFGEVRWSKDALGRELHLHHDKLGRLYKRVDQDGETAWVWDLALKGALSEVHSPDGAIERALYDVQKGRVSGTELLIGGETFSVGYSYDAVGRPERVRYPDADGVPFEVELGLDGAGHLNAVRDVVTQGAYWSLSATDGAGRITGEVLGQGITTIRKWFGERDRVATILTTAAGGMTLQDLGYDYDPEQNVRLRRDVRQGKTEHFLHDGLDRLTCASFDAAKSCAREWRYAANGNLERTPEIGSIAYTDPEHVHAATGADGESFGYDAVGNQITRPGHTITYTAFDQPKEFTAKDGAAAVLLDYGGDGMRIRKSTPDAVTIYVGGLYERITRSTGEVEHRYYVHGPERPIAVVTKKAGGVEARYLHVDALGSVDVVTDSLGQNPERTSFDPFGKRRNPVWGDAPAGAGPPGIMLGFTGHEEDEEIGLVHMKGRLFDPRLGRFLTPDPFVTRPWSGQGWNPYSYVLNNPLRYTDPSGFTEVATGEDLSKPVAGELWMPWDHVQVPLDIIRQLSGRDPGEDVGGSAGSGDVTTLGEPVPQRAAAPAAEVEKSGIDIAKEVLRGASERASEVPVELALGMAMNLISPPAASGGYGLPGVQADLDGAGGRIADGLNQGNPLYAVSIDVIKGVDAGKQGDYEALGRAGMGVVATVVVTVITLKAGAKGPSTKTGPVKDIVVQRSKYPTAAAHIADAQRAGYPSVLTINRAGAKANRAAAQAGRPKVAGMDLDEYPPAMFEEGGRGASVRPIPLRDNRGAGGCIRAGCAGLPDGTQVRIVVE